MGWPFRPVHTSKAEGQEQQFELTKHDRTNEPADTCAGAYLFESIFLVICNGKACIHHSTCHFFNRRFGQFFLRQGLLQGSLVRRRLFGVIPIIFDYVFWCRHGYVDTKQQCLLRYRYCNINVWCCKAKYDDSTFVCRSHPRWLHF